MNLGDRMKKYELAFRNYLPNRLPVIIRVDGKCFHTFTRGMDRPFDAKFHSMMDYVGLALMVECQGSRLAYIQSDEVSVLLYPWQRHESQGWFNNELPKIISVAAATASAAATRYHAKWGPFGNNHQVESVPILFDARAFVLPESDIDNYFIWRQQDWERNSILMYAQANFSHKELHGKKAPDMHEMLHGIGLNWATLPLELKHGRAIFSGGPVQPAPIFKNNRELIRGLMNVPELS